MEFIRKHTRLLFVLILPVYFYIVQNTIQNKHSHVQANGVVVTHSHPLFGDSNEAAEDHDHDKSEICLYSSLHIDLYDVPQFSKIIVWLEEKRKEYCVVNDQTFSSPQYQKSIPRGPPAYV